MSDWTKLAKRQRGILTDKCSVSSTTITLGRAHVARLKDKKSVDIYIDRDGSRIGMIPREDDEGYSLRIRSSGVANVGTKNLIERMNVSQGRYKAKWTTTEIDGEEKEILTIDVKLKSSEKLK
jgi:hypothetical protein